MHRCRISEIGQKVTAADFRPLDVLLVGATGVGKSSTLNALFGEQKAKVGTGVDPETQLVESYMLNDVLRFWDSSGLGDGKETDRAHRKKLIDVLSKTYTHSDGQCGWIDLVFVILDGSSRDLGTTYDLLRKMIDPDRAIVAINQVDMGMKGRYWDRVPHQPLPNLQQFLDEKAESVQKRLLEATGLQISKPVYYSAYENYHLKEIMDAVINHIPVCRRKMNTL
ncbi:GTPase family protein [Neisseria blantyrii]|uniref:GTPase family protein n=1 Tax=Neisseria blantyrii TaxID=2830647 RepID=UPI00272CFBB5|nr:GTPase [Neisseria blantyrii]